MRELDWISPLEVKDSHDERTQQIEEAARFGATYDQDGETHSFAALAPAALEANEQLSLQLDGYTERAAVRRALASTLEREVLPYAPEEWLQRYPERLRGARQSGHFGIRLKTGKPVVFWDSKAGLSRLCPDDAREEAMRLRRRVTPRVDELVASGHRLLYCVFTLPNSAPGQLRDGMQAIIDRFKRSVLKAKDADGEKLFPEIKGALAVLEAPLGESRDWNVHLNVILVIAPQVFFDFGKLRQHWHWNVHMRWIGGSRSRRLDDPGELAAFRKVFNSAFAELIKYAVATTVAKSAEHAAAGKSRAPPMLEWSRDELLEWLRGMHGFRRTRAYGVLYGLDAPEKEDLGDVVWVGSVSLRGGRYVHRLALLDWIPEDKSLGLSNAERWQILIKSLLPRELAGADELGAGLPPVSHLLG